MTDAYYSNDLKCWVRLVREADDEWCHTSGFDTREDALEAHLLAPSGFVSHFGGKSEWQNTCDKEA